MRERCAGSVLVVDEQQRLSGSFTGRDAVRALAEGKDAAATILALVMTPHPTTITPDSLAIEALRKMNDGGFRHLPVVEGGTIGPAGATVPISVSGMVSMYTFSPPAITTARQWLPRRTRVGAELA